MFRWLHRPRQPDFSLESRLREIDRKFGRNRRDDVLARLANVRDPSDRLLAAIAFMAVDGRPESVDAGVASANQDATHYLQLTQVVADRRPGR